MIYVLMFFFLFFIVIRFVDQRHVHGTFSNRFLYGELPPPMEVDNEIVERAEYKLRNEKYDLLES